MYNGLAAVYDRIQNTDFSAWADLVIQLERRYQRRAGTGDGRDGQPILLDLGCGTGGFCLEMARRGYEPIGIDLSFAMLAAARQKQLDQAAGDCLFLQQDISRFELFGTVDIIVSLLDTVNHLTRIIELKRMFKLCANYLNPGGLMIFDLLTLGYMSEKLGDKLFFIDEEGFSLVWQNKFWPNRQLSRADLTLFIEQANGFYQRYDERISERYYARPVIESVLADSGLSLVACHTDRELTGSSYNTRDFYILRK